MAYAYLDQYGFLHVVDDKKTAVEYAKGKVVEVANIPFVFGFPVVGEQIQVRRVNGQLVEKEGANIPDNIRELYAELEG
jgi:hypothetical protein